MIISLALEILIAAPIMFIFFKLYVALSLGIERKFSGSAKIYISLLAYLCFAPVLVLPFVYLCRAHRHAMDASYWNSIIVLLAWVLIVTPGTLYFRKYKNREIV